MNTQRPGRVVEQDHWPADEALRLDSYRRDERGRLLGLWLCAVGFVYGGLALAGVGWLSKGGSAWLARLGSYAGMTAFGVGIFAVVHGLFKSLRREHYLSLRKDGVLMREGGPARLLAWSELEDVQSDSPSHVVLHLSSGETCRLDVSMLGIDARELAKRMAHHHRRARWGFYDS